MEWQIHSGDSQASVDFRGKGGTFRILRKDEIVISDVSNQDDSGVLGKITCHSVLGRKAWRIDSKGKEEIAYLVTDLNAGKFSSLEILEAIERKFEGGK